MHHPRETLGWNLNVQFQLMQKIGRLLQQISSSDPVPSLQIFSYLLIKLFSMGYIRFVYPN